MSCKRFCSALLLLGSLGLLYAQANQPLRLEKTIPLPEVQNRIDHMFFDAASGRLFVAALGNNTVEVIDSRLGKRVHTISGLHEPQGILYLPGPNRLYVANGEDGSLRIYDGTSYGLISNIKLGDDADNIRWDDETKQVYVGYGSGALAAVDEKGAKTGEILLAAHPESFRLEAHGPKIFVNLPGSRKVAVVDRKTKSVIANWSTGGALANYPMALDEPDNRLFIVCRRPARLIVLDTNTGQAVGNWPVVGDCDDVFYDAATKRIYASGGEGEVSVFQQQNANGYRQTASLATRKGARTSLFSPESRALYVAARRQGSEAAAIYVYHVQP
ncbi:MAG: YncE family protein [Acidobacteriota bacterium]|nr:YncE family protein [Acidobacteriota bacterium]